MARTQKNTLNNTKHTEHQDATDIQKNTIVCVCRKGQLLIAQN